MFHLHCAVPKSTNAFHTPTLKLPHPHILKVHMAHVVVELIN